MDLYQQARVDRTVPIEVRCARAHVQRRLPVSPVLIGPNPSPRAAHQGGEVRLYRPVRGHGGGLSSSHSQVHPIAAIEIQVSPIHYPPEIQAGMRARFQSRDGHLKLMRLAQ